MAMGSLRASCWAAIVAVTTLLAACGSSSSSSTGSGGGDAGSSGTSGSSGASGSSGELDGGGDAKPDAPGDAGGGGACGTSANVGRAIDGQQVAMAAPTATGGTIADGTYTLTDITLYTGSGGATGPAGLTLTQTWGFSGGSYRLVSLDGTTMTETRKGGTVMNVSATALHLVQTCPDSDFASYEFSATATTLTLFTDEGAGTKLALTLTRQ